MKKYSIEAKDLLSKAEKYEIKAGEDLKGNNNNNAGNCDICAICVACSTCTACTSKALDIVLEESLLSY